MIRFYQELLDFCKLKNIKFQGHTCLGGAYCDILLGHPCVKKGIATKLVLTPADVLFKYAMKKVGHVIIKSATPARVNNAVEKLNDKGFNMGGEDMKRLSGLADNVNLTNFKDTTILLSWLKEYSPSVYD